MIIPGNKNPAGPAPYTQEDFARGPFVVFYETTHAIVQRIFEHTRQCHDAGWPLEVLTVDNPGDVAYLLMQLEKEDTERAKEAEARLRRTGGNRSGCDIAAVEPTYWLCSFIGAAVPY